MNSETVQQILANDLGMRKKFLNDCLKSHIRKCPLHNYLHFAGLPATVGHS